MMVIIKGIGIISNIVHKISDKFILCRKAKADLEDCEVLAKPISQSYSYEILSQNDFYGNAEAIKKYCNINSKEYIRGSIEHAVYLDDGVWPQDINHSYRQIITLSNHRKDILLAEGVDKQINVIGPYIAYASRNITDTKFSELKSKYGKVLLVFPTHSTTQVNIDYDIEEFIEVIEKMRIGYDTVMVCVYWKDVLAGKHLIYKNRGYVTVCAGHLYDLMFLNRLRTIIELSDYILSNDFGSYIGQGAFFGKPSFIYNQRKESSSDDVYYLEEYNNVCEYVKRGIDLFSTYHPKLTEEQLKYCRDTWGIDCFKTCQELKKIIFD